VKFCVVMLFIGAALWSRRTFDTGTAVGNYFDSEVPVGPAKTEGQPCTKKDEVAAKFCCGGGIVKKGVKKLTSNECRDKINIASLKPLPPAQKKTPSNRGLSPGEKCTDMSPLPVTNPPTCCSEELKIVVNGEQRMSSRYCEASPLHVLRVLTKKAPELVNVFQHCASQNKFATGEGAFKELYTEDFIKDFSNNELKKFLGITGAKKLDERFQNWKWEAEKKEAFNKAYFRIRHFVVYCFVNLMIEAVQKGGLQAVISAPGSSDPTSDIDVSISGSGAIVVLEGYYKLFDEYAKQDSKPMGLSEQSKTDSISSMEKFDANLYCGNYLISIPDTKKCSDFSPLYVEVGTKKDKKEKNCILQNIFFESAYVDELGVAFAKLDYFLEGLTTTDPNHAYVKDNLKVRESLDTFAANGYKYAANAPQKFITDNNGELLKASFNKWQGHVKVSKVKIAGKSFAEGNDFTKQDNIYKDRMALYQKATNAADTAPPAAASGDENLFKGWHENAIWLAMTAQESYFSRGPFLAVVVGDQLRGGVTSFDDKILGRNMRVDDFMTAVIENLADLIKDFGHYTAPDAGDPKDKLVKFFAKGSKYAYRFLESASALNYYYGDKLTEQSAPHWYVQGGVLTEPERKKVMNALLVAYGIRWFCRDDPVGNCGGKMGCWNAEKIAEIVPKFMKMIIEVYKRVILRSETKDTNAITDLDFEEEGGFLSSPCVSPDEPNKFLGTIVHGVNRVAVRTCLTDGAKELVGEDRNVNCIFNNGRHIKRVLPGTTGLKLRKEIGGCNKNPLQDLAKENCDALSFKEGAIRIEKEHCIVGQGQQARPICKTATAVAPVTGGSSDKTGQINADNESTGKTNGDESHIRVEKSVKLDLH